MQTTGRGKFQFIMNAIGLCVMIAMIARLEKSEPTKTTLESGAMMWYISYESEANDYIVRIDESQQTDQAFGQRIIHLESPESQMVWITGCDADMDGVWDRIFWNRYDEKRPGCNSYMRDGTNRWTYVPCDGDITSDPIPEAEIGLTISKFREVMEEVRGVRNIRQLITYKSQVYLEAPKNRPSRTSF